MYVQVYMLVAKRTNRMLNPKWMTAKRTSISLTRNYLILLYLVAKKTNKMLNPKWVATMA